MAARTIASRTTIAPRSGAVNSLRAPPNEPIGVRQAERRTAEDMVGSRIRSPARLRSGLRSDLIDRGRSETSRLLLDEQFGASRGLHIVDRCVTRYFLQHEAPVGDLHDRHFGHDEI